MTRESSREIQRAFRPIADGGARRRDKRHSQRGAPRRHIEGCAAFRWARSTAMSTTTRRPKGVAQRDRRQGSEHGLAPAFLQAQTDGEKPAHPWIDSVERSQPKSTNQGQRFVI